MAASRAYLAHAHEIGGHPVAELYLVPEEEPTLITCCANCGELRTILFLSKDRWLCTKCRMEGNARPNLYPIA